MLNKNVLVWNDEFTFISILEKMDKEGNGFLVIINNSQKLLGIITDGDVRRAILNKKENVWEIINTNPITVLDHFERHEVIKLLHKIQRKQIPVVNSDNELKNIIYLDDNEVYYYPNYVVIMAGGLGSRLGDLTKNTPKPMLPIGGKPILENILISFKESGFNNFIFCVNYKSNIIIDYFTDGSNWGVNITYSYEENKMGTAGALSLIKSHLQANFFVINGDILTTVDYLDLLNFHNEKKSTLTMCVKKFNYQIPYACLDIDNNGKVKSLKEKPNYDYSINAGIYVLNPECIENIPFNEYYDMTTLIEILISENKLVYSYNLDEYWLDIGHKSDYKKANEDLAKNF